MEKIHGTVSPPPILTEFTPPSLDSRRGSAVAGFYTVSMVNDWAMIYGLQMFAVTRNGEQVGFISYT